MSAAAQSERAYLRAFNFSVALDHLENVTAPRKVIAALNRKHRQACTAWRRLSGAQGGAK